MDGRNRLTRHSAHDAGVHRARALTVACICSECYLRYVVCTDSLARLIGASCRVRDASTLYLECSNGGQLDEL
jgi:hypothetical protein